MSAAFEMNNMQRGDVTHCDMPCGLRNYNSPGTGISVKEKRSWELGGCSLYFRDPDRHLLELATPGTWSVY